MDSVPEIVEMLKAFKSRCYTSLLTVTALLAAFYILLIESALLGQPLANSCVEDGPQHHWACLFP